MNKAKYNNQFLRLHFHALALFMEAIGTSLIMLDTIRLNRITFLLGFTSYDGEPKEYQKWYYHSALAGFIFLFGGMILAALVLYLEHRSHLNLDKKCKEENSENQISQIGEGI